MNRQRLAIQRLSEEAAAIIAMFANGKALLELYETDHTLNRYRKSQKIEEIEKELESSARRRTQVYKWTNETAAKFEALTGGKLTAHLFRSYPNTQHSRVAPSGLESDELWNETAGRLEWLARRLANIEAKTQ